MTSRCTGRSVACVRRWILLVVTLLTGVVFAASCLALQGHGGFHRSLEVLIGARSPFGDASGLVVVLSLLGYALIPTVIGLAAADAVTRFTRKRLTTREEAEAFISELVGQALAQKSPPKAPANPGTQAGGLAL
jgi:hypothetical protein